MLFCRREFIASESGTIIYTKRADLGMPTARYAVGILKGVRPGTGEGTMRQAIYEATVIHRALEEICDKSNIGNVRVFQ